MFSKDIQLPVTTDKADERDRPVRDEVDTWQRELWERHDWVITLLVDEL